MVPTIGCFLKTRGHLQKNAEFPHFPEITAPIILVRPAKAKSFFRNSYCCKNTFYGEDADTTFERDAQALFALPQGCRS